jgi:hypothetical protein
MLRELEKLNKLMLQLSNLAIVNKKWRNCSPQRRKNLFQGIIVDEVQVLESAIFNASLKKERGFEKESR